MQHPWEGGRDPNGPQGDIGNMAPGTSQGHTPPLYQQIIILSNFFYNDFKFASIFISRHKILYIFIIIVSLLV